MGPWDDNMATIRSFWAPRTDNIAVRWAVVGIIRGILGHIGHSIVKIMVFMG